ncbi:MAG: hypothetical protein AB7O47_04685 [Flavobacteriales bacterium]
MKQLLLFCTFITILACNNEPGKEFFDAKNNTSKEKNLATVNTLEKDTTAYAENVSPDGSWEVLINSHEGFFIGYVINYKDGSKSISKKVNSEIDIISGIDHPDPRWIDVKTYQIPNIGGTANGYYELRIYKDGSCKYIEHTANIENIDTVMDTETEIVSSATDENKEPQIENSYSQNENFIVFRQDIKNFGDKSIGCSSSESSLSMVIQNVTDSFEFKNEELSAVKLNYNYSGGLNDFIGEKPFKGYIKGKLLSDNTWKIELDIWISTFSYVENEKGKKQIKTSGIFKP